MNNRRPLTDALSGPELGHKLLQSVKEMKAGQAAGITKVEPGRLSVQPERWLDGVCHSRLRGNDGGTAGMTEGEQGMTEKRRE